MSENPQPITADMESLPNGPLIGLLAGTCSSDAIWIRGQRHFDERIPIRQTTGPSQSSTLAPSVQREGTLEYSNWSADVFLDVKNGLLRLGNLAIDENKMNPEKPAWRYYIDHLHRIISDSTIPFPYDDMADTDCCRPELEASKACSHRQILEGARGLAEVLLEPKLVEVDACLARMKKDIALMTKKMEATEAELAILKQAMAKEKEKKETPLPRSPESIDDKSRGDCMFSGLASAAP